MNLRAKFVLSIGLLSLLCLMLPGSLRAQTVYTYTGPDFTTFYGSDNSSEETNLSGSFTVSKPLLGGLTDSYFTPTSFSFTDGFATLTNLNTSGAGDSVTFFVSTSSLGKITGWEYELIGGSPENYFESVYLSGVLDDKTYDPNGGVFSYSNEAQVIVYSTTTPVVWVQSTPSTTIPEPGTATLTLTGLGLLGLVVVLRKRIALRHPQAT